ncbi:uncharacterized protein RSE6_02939 [Rhynchosporium secalis]|uniref:Extracellular membrane protein CFEM domain-containing protein n=1 Tax=Rhynchosporium secalis TaxID=38038 RepID=A0A1E1M1L2_RHYSE|nr:uncharacterized protein RSE6_02939 [Rhynchosporium secalis]
MQFSIITILALVTSVMACSQANHCCWADVTACEQESAPDCHTRDFIFAQCENWGVKCADGDCCNTLTGEAMDCN